MTPTLQNVLSTTANSNAAIIHITCGSPISIRTSGELRFLEEFGVISPPHMQEFLGELLTPEERAFLAEQKNFLGSKKLSRDHRYRIHIVFEKGLPAVTLHMLPIRIAPFESLPLPARARELLALDQGLVVVSGPMGSGKTSTIASLCESWNQSVAKRMILIQKPIEFTLESNKSHIEHVEVGFDAPTFLSALTNVEGEDYDVVYLSEWSEPGVLEHLFTLAAAGTCVILEMRNATTSESLEQLVASANRNGISFPESHVAERFSGSLNVRLLPGVRSPLVLAAEVAFAIPELRIFIRSKKFDALARFLEISREGSVISLDESIALLVDRALVTFDHALPFVHNPDRFQRLVKGMLIPLS